MENINFICFKIRHEISNKYSKGGMCCKNPNWHWSTFGKCWNSLNTIKNHLFQYCENSSQSFKNKIPDEWIVEVYLYDNNNILKCINIKAKYFYPLLDYKDVIRKYIDKYNNIKNYEYDLKRYFLKEFHKIFNMWLKDIANKHNSGANVTFDMNYDKLYESIIEGIRINYNI